MTQPENQPVILSGCRTPSGKFQGGLSSFTAPALGAIVVAETVKRAALKELAEVDEVIMGNVVGAGLGQNPARQAAIHGGWFQRKRIADRITLAPFLAHLRIAAILGHAEHAHQQVAR